MTSTDGGATFSLSNEGFSERKVSALLVDRGNAAHLFAGVVNDKKFGGVFVFGGCGRGVEADCAGLDGRDVIRVVADQGRDGGGRHEPGIFALDPPAAPDAAQPAGETAGGRVRR